MKTPRNRRTNRKPYDRRADTPEARAIREERRQRRLSPADSESARAMYSFWLNDFMSTRLPDPPPAPKPARPTTRPPLSGPGEKRAPRDASRLLAALAPFYYQ